MKISDDIELPTDVVTSTLAILAQKGKGKSYTAAVFAEELLEAGQQVVLLDPTGAHWGLRSSADGKGAGHPIAVLGGEHADVPLEAGAGAIIAQAVASKHFSCIIDTSLFTKGEELRFMAAFLETLYRKNRTPLHLIIDEADVVAPQRPMGEDARTLGACQNIVRRGRIRGIGCTLITQRPAVLSKDVLSQVDALCVLGMNHPKDLGAIDEWVRVHADPVQAKAMIVSLPKLPIGQAWWWWPTQEIFQQAKTRKRHTFDSGATPKAGQALPQAKVLAPVDIARLGAEIAATAEAAKESDPKALRADLARAKAEIETLRRRSPAVEVRHEREPAYLDDDLTKMRAAADALIRACQQLLDRKPPPVPVSGNGSTSRVQFLGNFAAPPRELPPKTCARCGGAVRDGHDCTICYPVERPRSVGGEDRALPRAQRLILTALAQHGDCGKSKLAILAGYAQNGGGFNNALSSLRTHGRIDDVGFIGSGVIAITANGLGALGAHEVLPPPGPLLRDHWMRELSKAEREVIRILAVEGPSPKEYVAIRAGYAANGGGFNNALSRLRTLGLIEGKAKLSLAPELRG